VRLLKTGPSDRVAELSPVIAEGSDAPPEQPLRSPVFDFGFRAFAGGMMSILRRHPLVVAAVLLGSVQFVAPKAQVVPKTQAAVVQTMSNARGAYFRKVASDARTTNIGIRGEGKLPEVSFDPARQYVSNAGVDHYMTGPLDRPSVYLGGRAANCEVDAGLTWDRVYDREGRATPNFAFRPFWRTSSGWHQPKRGAADNVYLNPGERFVMSVRVVGKKRLRLEIRSLDRDLHFAKTFVQPGFGVGKAQAFKRVNAIDQFWVDASGERHGRENQDVLPTRTRAVGAAWSEVTLLDVRKDRSTPFSGGRFSEVFGRDTHALRSQIFGISNRNDRGGETVDIVPPS
jgi:hypothetical protein